MTEKERETVRGEREGEIDGDRREGDIYRE